MNLNGSKNWIVLFLKQFYIHGICVPVESSDQSKGDKEKLVFYLKIGEEL